MAVGIAKLALLRFDFRYDLKSMGDRAIRLISHYLFSESRGEKLIRVL